VGGCNWDNSAEAVVKPGGVVRIVEIVLRLYHQGTTLEAIPLVEALFISFPHARLS
jgi:hypothetical protein